MSTIPKRRAFSRLKLFRTGLRAVDERYTNGNGTAKDGQKIGAKP